MMATSINLLRVPIRVDALYVSPKSGDGYQLGAFAADFSTLPYYTTDGPKNDRNPNFSLTLVKSLPSSLTFPAGLHLHWALPDALANGRHDESGTRFPAVPNRWLVRRFDDKRTLQKAWIVESDFLHPCGDKGVPKVLAPPKDQGHPITAWPAGNAITFPTRRFQLSSGKPGAAYRYMGRSRLLSDWLKNDGGGSDQYLNQDANSAYKLTALGYGEPAFAAYYPNCYSVFGFCDVDPTLDGAASYEYEIIGWFHESDLDPLQAKEFKDLFDDDPARFAALAKEYRWLVGKDDAKKAFPARMVCYASLAITPNSAPPWKPSDGEKVDIAIANTGGEALSALFAEEFAQDQASGDPDRAEIKRIAEDQLEAMNLASSLQGASVDFAARFAQARHQRGFRGVHGGTRWAVIPKSTKPASAAQADAAPQPPLPDVVAHALDALNAAQEAYDVARQEITELRCQAFFDWHKYLEAVYSNAPALEPFHAQRSDAARFIRATSLQLLNEKLAVVGKLDVTKQKVTAESVDGSDRATLDLGARTLSPPNPKNADLATQAVLRLKALIDAMFGAKLLDGFVLTNRAAESFWQPREPVVLLSGRPAVSTDRHGEDGELPCGLLAVPDAPGTPEFIAHLDALRPSAGDRALQSQTQPPWHPIILEWKADVNTSVDGRTLNPDVDTKALTEYAREYVAGLFQIPENEPDFSPMKTRPTLLDQKYSGRCALTPTAGTQLDINLTAFLLKTTLYDCRDRGAELNPDDLDRLIKWHEARHGAKPPLEVAARVAWSKLQKPFVADGKTDDRGKPVLLPVDDLATWYEAKPVSGGSNTTFASLSPKLKAQDPPYGAIQALRRQGKMTVLSQSLGGFNSALMTRERVLQIPIEDPVGRGGTLTADIAKAVGVHHPAAPLGFEIYSPIRLGGLTLSELRLLDTFGQSWQATLEGARLVKCNALTAPDLHDPNFTYLPPRFAPPLRLNFRWLAALSGQDGVDEVEMNSAPATSPICGWLLANHFDDSLMIYDAKGQALGSINLRGQWMPAPGLPAPIAGAEIVNPHLRRLVRRLVVSADATEAETQRRRDFLSSFLDVLDGAIETIEPASFAQHEALALLMGRPIALVRARVELQLMGQPAVSERVDDSTIAGGQAIVLKKSNRWKTFSAQGWDVFADDWGRFYDQCSFKSVMDQSCLFLEAHPLADYERTTHGFEKVVVPVRLGEHQLLNDGLVGYWKETPEGDLDNVFHSPQTPDNLQIIEDVDYDKVGPAHPCIRARRPGVADEFGMALADDPQTLTLLMDPRGVVHATCGVLPVSQLEIPSAYYAETLKHIGITFCVSPLLTDSEQLHAAVPKEAGYEWSWVTRPSGSTWNETGDIVDATEHVHFFRPPKIVEGWLKLSPKANKS
jgi:hypothetical protein